QRVMTGALPAPSDSYRRTRVERVAPNLLGWDWQNPNVPSSDFQRTDQLMLSSGAFLPRCTEFIVEWSFGLENKADEVRASAFSARLPGNQPAPARPARVNLAPANSVFWHGLPRQVRLGGNVISSTIPYAEYYTLDQPGNPYTNLTGNAFWQALRDQYYYSQPVRLRNGETRLVPHVVKPELIETLSTFGGPAVSPSVYYATFGYVDPTWAPETRLTRGNGQPFLAIDRNGNGRFDSDDGDLRAVELERDVNGNGQYDPEDGDRVVLNEPETIPWAWPTMIRVTFSLADDGAGTSPATEQTFQVIVELPREQGPKGN
ncbi:MAG: hypothetical protein MUE97_00130, partial [Phycisphaerales bacterium]|nr:hypothetical protein [Phycisphaerales bacterium]